MTELYDKIKRLYMAYFSKYQTSQNLLLTGILYCIDLISVNELENLRHDLPKFYRKLETNDDNYDTYQLFMSFILHKLAIKIIYNLPYMLNKPNENSIISPHIIFGENVTQLVGFCLITESSNILNILQKKHNKIVNDIEDVQLKQNNIILNTKGTNISKQVIIHDYYEKCKCLIRKYNNYFELFINESQNES